MQRLYGIISINQGWNSYLCCRQNIWHRYTYLSLYVDLWSKFPVLMWISEAPSPMISIQVIIFIIYKVIKEKSNGLYEIYQKKTTYCDNTFSGNLSMTVCSFMNQKDQVYSWYLYSLSNQNTVVDIYYCWVQRLVWEYEQVQNFDNDWSKFVWEKMNIWGTVLRSIQKGSVTLLWGIWSLL